MENDKKKIRSLIVFQRFYFFWVDFEVGRGLIEVFMMISLHKVNK